MNPGIILATMIGAVTVQAEWKYPETKTVEVTDTYHGKTYQDPYRWLENTQEKEVEAWFKAQGELTDGLLGKIPGREALAKEWMELDKLKPTAYSGIAYENGRVFYKKTLGGENVGKIYFREGWSGAEKLLFDPTSYQTGVVTVVQTFLPSWDGKHVVLGLTSAGQEWSELRVLDVEKGTLLPEKIFPSWGGTGWNADNRSFFYDAGDITDVKSQEILLNRKTRLHKLGIPVASDVEIFSNAKNPDLEISAREVPQAFIDESYPEYIFGFVATVQSEARIFYAPTAGVKTGRIEWKTMAKLSDNLVRGFVPQGEYVYAVTHTGAPKYKVVRTSIRNPNWATAETIIPEAADSVQFIAKSKNYLFVVYSNGIVGRIVKYEFATGKTSEVKLPASGTVAISCPDFRTDKCLVEITSWTFPATRYDYDAKGETFAKSAFNSDVSYPGFDQLVIEEVEVPSHDGTMVPLSIVHKKGIPLDGSNSCILEGYGSYGYSFSPHFSIHNSIARDGVVLAFAHPRGGGEKGEAWYKAGFKSTKPNTWKDFIACAEYLVKKGYTSPAKLGGTGTSAGGILISRAITERPDLFRAVICNVGCANAMRMEFEASGPINVPEFGTVKDPVECAALYEMDGVAHVKKGTKYSAVMGVAGWNDPRVAAWQPGKFIAALQHASTSSHPMLMQVNYDNGHFTEEKVVTFRNFATQVAFLLWQTGHKSFQPVH